MDRRGPDRPWLWWDAVRKAEKVTKEESNASTMFWVGVLMCTVGVCFWLGPAAALFFMGGILVLLPCIVLLVK